jgi:hypothetical protein
MTDKELLELAAKAAGYKIELWGSPDYCSHRTSPVAFINADKRLWEEWNPLTDDGDALRLAVRLKLLDEHAGFTYVLAEEHLLTADKDAATRRAIVRAAAEIGKAMP